MGPTAGPGMRPVYHFSVPDNWKNDPQRPVYVAGEYLYYYLYNADYVVGGTGTAWRLATTRDHVSFEDRGVAIPKSTNANGDCWSGSVVVDEHGTAGRGAGAVFALVTQNPGGQQAQFLWCSTDGGRSFTADGLDPVLPNPGVADFRDPKVIRDDERDRWVMALAEGSRIGFYASTDLRAWAFVGEFVPAALGVLECPDLFRMTADDGSSHWVLGLSPLSLGRSHPATYAYWTGDFDGSRFTADREQPDWLDWGFDFYGAVTYPHHLPSGAEDPGLRRAIGWANAWLYAHNTPTLASDGRNGDDSIVRELRLRRGDGEYYLASAPPAALADRVTCVHRLGDVEVGGAATGGIQDLGIRSPSYDLTCELEWDAAAPPGDIGFEVLRPPGGGRQLTLGAHLHGPPEGGPSDRGPSAGRPHVYVDRWRTANPAGGRSQTPLDPAAGRLALRLLVDRTSVELFVGDGRVVHSHRVFPLDADDGIRLCVRDGTAVFRDLTVREIGP
ncbi:MAG: glycoside hydrolase family 32 protein [Microbacterium sp.]